MPVYLRDTVVRAVLQIGGKRSGSAKKRFRPIDFGIGRGRAMALCLVKVMTEKM
jgi:hypothetical protein